jgi:hypothetical protein
MILTGRTYTATIRVHRLGWPTRRWGPSGAPTAYMIFLMAHTMTPMITAITTTMINSVVEMIPASTRAAYLTDGSRTRASEAVSPGGTCFGAAIDGYLRSDDRR